MTPVSPTLNHWWWMLAALLTVAVLMSVLRSWLGSRPRSGPGDRTDRRLVHRRGRRNRAGLRRSGRRCSGEFCSDARQARSFV